MTSLIKTSDFDSSGHCFYFTVTGSLSWVLPMRWVVSFRRESYGDSLTYLGVMHWVSEETESRNSYRYLGVKVICVKGKVSQKFRSPWRSVWVLLSRKSERIELRVFLYENDTCLYLKKLKNSRLISCSVDHMGHYDRGFSREVVYVPQGYYVSRHKIFKDTFHQQITNLV